MTKTDSQLRAKFFPQNGGMDQRILWYGDSSFLLDVKLWWAPDSNDKGKIMVHSDNSPYDYLMGACDSASRVVSYVVVMGQGYSSNSLLDMRIHDITVVVDPNRQLPAAPESVEADATYSGYVDLGPRIISTDSYTRSLDALNNGAIAPVPYWTGYWPVLHHSIKAL